MFVLKVVASTITIILITEIAKRYTPLAGIIAGLPINILISMCWLYFEKRDLSIIANLSQYALIGIFSTFVFLIIVTYFLRKQWDFFPTIALGLVFLTVFCYISGKMTTQI